MKKRKATTLGIAVVVVCALAGAAAAARHHSPAVIPTKSHDSHTPRDLEMNIHATGSFARATRNRCRSGRSAGGSLEITHLLHTGIP